MNWPNDRSIKTPREVGIMFANIAMKLAEESSAFDSWQSCLNDAARIIKDPEIAPLLRTRFGQPDDLIELMDERMEETGASEKERRFIRALTRYGHLKYMPFIAEAFEDRCKQILGIVNVHVQSVTCLSSADTSSIKEYLKDRYNIIARISNTVHPELISGRVIRLPDRIIDLSARGYRAKKAKLEKDKDKSPGF